MRTKEQLRLGLTRLGTQSAHFKIPIGPDCWILQQETLDAAYGCPDGTYVDVSARALFLVDTTWPLEDYANQKSAMEIGDEPLAERQAYRTVTNSLGPFTIERLHKVSDNENRTCADIVTEEDLGLSYVIRYCFNRTPEGIRAIEKIRAGIKRGGLLPGTEFYTIE